MEKLIKPARLAFISILIAALVVTYLVALYRLQIVDGAAAYEESLNSRNSKETVTAARGSILDRYGRVLVTNRTCNNLIIDTTELFADGEEAANEIILEVCRLIEEYGDEYIDELPITKESPFEFTSMTSVQRERLNAWIDKKSRDYGVDRSSTAVEIMAAMRARYHIDNNYSGKDARTIAGIRYEINVRYDIPTSDYIFAEDVSMELITRLLESSLPGFEVTTSYVREYNTNYAAHILGYTNVMSTDEYKYYSKQGYPLNARVGKDGVEYVFEDYLHGVDGLALITRTSEGIVTSTTYLEEPVPGNNVYITLDIGLQEAAENALSSFITSANLERVQQNAEVEMYGVSNDGEHDSIQEYITGGAVVAVDIPTGEPLAIASWPSYDTSRIIQDWSEIVNGENNPLFNRALNGTYAPGSTFKPVTAMAGLCEGKIDTTTTIECEGIFDKYTEAGYAPRCWIYGQGLHGELTLTEAITFSCNYYFYTVADYLQISLLAKYAKLYGLGEPTGIELPENVGQMSTDQYTQKWFGRDMYAGDTLQAGIGQSFSEFNTLQMAEYTAAIANGGNRHSASILKSVRSFDYSENLYDRQTELLSSVEANPYYYDVVHEGMRGVITDPLAGSVFLVFADAPYTAAAKTGTAQRGEDKANNGFFIVYAPYEDPQIAVAVAVEKVGAGATTSQIARQVLDYYFSFMESTVALEGENRLLR
ncbi:MAG: penicillin-binding transpeptidase domain-containing protein [Butyricicoccus sp.]|nr:penicillin-binding transpeptidase domain-containing protein [Butyricicoccus sp.]